MQEEFWQAKWESQQIGFHNPTAHPMLVKHLASFELRRGARVFVPLCGKSLDMHWLKSEGYKVVGVELVESAVVALFEELGIKPDVRPMSDHVCYSAEGIEIFVGDILTLTREQVGEIDFVYDRASLVALPKTTRERYAAHVMDLVGEAPQMLIVFEYDQSAMKGPPFAIFEAEIDALYGARYSAANLESQALKGKLKGQVDALEIAKALYVG